jgi:hypothetical protein
MWIPKFTDADTKYVGWYIGELLDGDGRMSLICASFGCEKDDHWQITKDFRQS